MLVWRTVVALRFFFLNAMDTGVFTAHWKGKLWSSSVGRSRCKLKNSEYSQHMKPPFSLVPSDGSILSGRTMELQFFPSILW